ncbi:zapA Cell division protein ZapA (stimulator of FtsZ polymerization and Z-ring component) [Burkholderiales bacterium]
MKKTQDQVEVQILDRSYRLACPPEDQAVLMDCVSLVDYRMRQVKQSGQLVGTDRIAVMAALTLAREVLAAGSLNVGQDLAPIRVKINQLASMTDDILAPQNKLFE